MGVMTYDGIRAEFDDRLLSHLHVVVMRKFRRGEAFPMSWLKSRDVGSGRSCVWLTPNHSIVFEFAGNRIPSIDRSWLDRLAVSADGPRGLVVTNEDGSPAHSGPVAHLTVPVRLPVPA